MSTCHRRLEPLHRRSTSISSERETNQPWQRPSTVVASPHRSNSCHPRRPYNKCPCRFMASQRWCVGFQSPDIPALFITRSHSLSLSGSLQLSMRPINSQRTPVYTPWTLCLSLQAISSLPSAQSLDMILLTCAHPNGGPSLSPCTPCTLSCAHHALIIRAAYVYRIVLKF